MECIGKNAAGNIILCACFVRQIKGCCNDEMISGKNARKNFTGIIEKIDWDKVTICRGFNEQSEDGRICICLAGQKQESCDLKMRIVSMTKADVADYIEDLNC
ncbi:MAG: hypothetical protein Q8N37_01725 [bacterium]|nr:hypothetical protein [bacterium]